MAAIAAASIALPALSALPAAATPGAPAASSNVASFRRQLDELVERDRVPGASAALVEDGETVWQGGVGRADRFTGEAVDDDTVFQVASLSKPVTALGVLLLAEDGRLDLDRPVWDYIESFSPPPSPHDPSAVTARLLLSHRGGVGLHGYPGYPTGRVLPSLLESLGGSNGGAGAVALVAPPGTMVRYSSGGYTILQLLVEEVTGEPFAEFMERRVLAPLGMTRSSFVPRSDVRVASGHGWWGGRLPAYRFREEAASGLLSTPGDLTRFLGVLWSRDARSAVGVSAATIDVMIEPPPGGGFALGFAVEAVPGVRVLSHTGANRGFRAILAAAPDRGDGFVVLTNSDRGLAMNADLLCTWALGVTELELASCWAERKRRGTLVAVAGLLGFGLLMDGASFARQRRRARLEPRPRWAPPAERHAWASWVRLSASVALLLGWWLFWYTEQFAMRREGIENFVPASSLPPTFFWLTVVLTSWCLLGIVRFVAAARAAAARPREEF